MLPLFFSVPYITKQKNRYPQATRAMRLLKSHHYRAESNKNKLTADIIGIKALGLLKLPPEWTPKFFIIPSELYEIWRASWQKDKEFELWRAALPLKTQLADLIDDITEGRKFKFILRSSVDVESLEDRGTYLSIPQKENAELDKVFSDIQNIFEQAYIKSPSVRVAIVVQRFVDASIIGHFSNETHLMPTRDRWLIEWEHDGPGIEAGINSLNAEMPNPLKPLFCPVAKNIDGILRKIGKWGNSKFSEKMHFEWLLSSERIWLLQLDFEQEDNTGVDPRTIDLSRSGRFQISNIGVAKLFKRFDIKKPSPWQKLKSVQDFYIESTPPRHRLFFCVGRTIEAVIGDKKLQARLRNEIEMLTGGRAVIRTDVKGKKGPQHNLPRTDTVNADDGEKWIRSTYKRIKSSGISSQDICFILHRFIPAVGAAWAYCVPGENIVQIDSLWGFPDGLQYLAHDSFEVDLRVQKVPSQRIRFKSYCVREGSDGAWEYARINRKFGRHSSLSKRSLLFIANQTRKIADKIKERAQVMWFCGIPESEELGQHIPWYRTTHFKNTQQQQKRYGRSIDIRTVDDLARLEGEDHRNLGIRVFPDVTLMRGEDFLDAIIDSARRHNLPIEIAGSSLGHAFYKFQSAGLAVHLAEPSRKYDRVRERHYFGKLVRDGIPDQIQSKGEAVVQAKLSPEELRVALTAKLIEEIFELTRASDQRSEKAELADMLEVFKSLISHLGFKYSEIDKAADEKRKKRGGFEEGRFLLETSLPKAEQSVLSSQFGLSRIAKIELGKVLYRRSGVIFPFTGLTQGEHRLTAEVVPGISISLEVTNSGLYLRLIKKDEDGDPKDAQLVLKI